MQVGTLSDDADHFQFQLQAREFVEPVFSFGSEVNEQGKIALYEQFHLIKIGSFDEAIDLINANARSIMRMDTFARYGITDKLTLQLHLPIVIENRKDVPFSPGREVSFA